MEVSTRRSPVEERPVLVRAALAQTPSIWWLIISILWKVWKAKHFKMKSHMHTAHCTQCKKCGKHFKMKSHMHTAQCTRCKKCGNHSKMKSHSAHNRLPPTRQWWLMLPISIAPCHAMLLLHRLGCENLFPFIFFISNFGRNNKWVRI